MNPSHSAGRGRAPASLPFETPLGIETTRWYGSVLDLFEAAVEAAAVGDEPRLRALRINEHEYETVLWPEFPAGARELYVGRDVWQNVDARSRRTEAWLCRCLRGRRWEIADVRFARGTDVYRTFSIHRGTLLTVRSLDRAGTLAVLGGIVDSFGRYKLLSLLEP